MTPISNLKYCADIPLNINMFKNADCTILLQKKQCNMDV